MADTAGTHPVVIIAAISVTLASLAATGYFTGLLPIKASASPPSSVQTTVLTPTTTTLPVSAKADTTLLAIPAGSTVTVNPEVKKTPTAPKPAPKAIPNPHSEAIYESRYNRNYQYDSEDRYRTRNRDLDWEDSRPARRPAPVSVAPPICHECGTIDRVQEIKVTNGGSGVGAVTGGVLGGVLGHQVGKGHGKDAATIVGAIGGAFGGNQIEKNMRTEKQYQITIRFDDGAIRTYTLANPNWRAGQRVRSVNGELTPL